MSKITRSEHQLVQATFWKQQPGLSKSAENANEGVLGHAPGLKAGEEF